MFHVTGSCIRKNIFKYFQEAAATNLSEKTVLDFFTHNYRIDKLQITARDITYSVEVKLI